MGFCPEQTHYKLVFADLKGEDGSDAPEIVMRRMSLGESLDFDDLIETEPTTDAEIRAKARAVVAKIADGLVSWNLVAPDGSDLPITVEGVLSLSDTVMIAIKDAWLAAIRGIPGELGKDSTPGGLAEASIPMEVLSPNLENWPVPAGS